MRTPSSISFRYGSHGLGEATLSHLLKPRMDPTHNPSYEDYEYVHDNSFFTNTSSRNRGFFIIAPDWVSERKGIMSTHYQWPADSWSLGMLSGLLIFLTVFLLFCTMATKIIQVHAVCFNVWPEMEVLDLIWPTIWENSIVLNESTLFNSLFSRFCKSIEIC